MARTIHKLTPAFVERRSKKPGLHGDGGGLYLCVTPPSARSWVFRYMLNGKAREMGLGSYPEVSLEAARLAGSEARALKAQGKDPIEARESVRASRRLQDAKAITFRHCAESYIDAHIESWRNAAHRAQWKETLETYAMALKTRHEAWKEELSHRKPGSHPSRITSEALELAIEEIRGRLASASATDETEALSLDAAMAYLRRHSQPA